MANYEVMELFCPTMIGALRAAVALTRKRAVRRADLDFRRIVPTTRSFAGEGARVPRTGRVLRARTEKAGRRRPDKSVEFRWRLL